MWLGPGGGASSAAGQRRRAANNRLAAQADQLVEESADLLDRLDASTAATELRGLVERLPPPQREALLMAAAGLSPTEIATGLGASPLAVRSRLLRARRQIRRHLSREGISPLHPSTPPGTAPRNPPLSTKEAPNA
ncbi:MAG: RNA polymerase sigma factor [Candidatus Dormibacteria bacterium]